MSKQNFIKRIKEFGLIILLSSTMAYFMGLGSSQEFQIMWKRFVITFVIWSVMWYGNAFVAYQLDHVYSFLKDPVKRLFLGLFGAALYSAVAMLAIQAIIKAIFNIDISGGSSINIIISIVLSILIMMSLLLREFLFSWRALALQEEKMKNEVLVSNFEILKSQVNPHFMFNSLNTLTSLIYQDQDLAAKYVSQLSKVYRSVLSTRKEEVIMIGEELKMLESYIFLQSIRFENKFKVNIDLSNEIKKKFIPPMVLQMLIENCIKHNEITEDNPLVIDVFIDGEMICVKNKIVVKQVLPGDNSSIGLVNIKARFQLLSNIPIKIINDGQEFIVQLPLLVVA